MNAVSFKFSAVLVVLAGFLALASAINLNHPGGAGPTPVEPALLQFLLDQQHNIPEPISVVPAETEASLWERAVLSPFSRMVSFLQQFGCDSAVAPTPTVQPPNTCRCGIQGTAANTTRIAGGQESTLKKWPWMAYLLIEKYVCGGSVISENWVITAAICVYSAKKIVVYLGTNDIRVTALHVTNATFTIHPNFEASPSKNDVALLKLEKPAPLSDAIQPICLPYKFSTTDFTGQNATVTGWGAINDYSPPLNKLLEVTMTILNQTQCTTSPNLYTPAQITDDQFCMYAGQADIGACPSDVGGPANYQNGAKTYLIGIVSLGICGIAGFPDKLTNVSPYLNWIKNTTGQSFCNI